MDLSSPSLAQTVDDFEYLVIGDSNGPRSPSIVPESLGTYHGARSDSYNCRPQHSQGECSACTSNNHQHQYPSIVPPTSGAVPPHPHGPFGHHGHHGGPSCRGSFPPGHSFDSSPYRYGHPHPPPPSYSHPPPPPPGHAHPPPPPPPHGCHRSRGRHHRGHGDHPQNPTQSYSENSSAQRSNVKLYLHKTILASHPKAGIMATDDWRVDLIRFAEYPENEAKLTPNSTELPGSPFVEYGYAAPQHRSTDGAHLGDLYLSGISWGRFDYTYKKEKFILYVAEWDEGFSHNKLQFLLHEPAENTQTVEDSKKFLKSLMLRAAYWAQELHNEVWVFDRGTWLKDPSLWDGMQKANWADVILPPDLKDALREDIGSFFKNKSTYDDIGIAWKRGIIMYGPPGNGKTISLKAIMKELQYSFELSPIPTLYVRSLQSWGGEQEALREIFEKARSLAPCMLVLEDLDSMINPRNRSYFLNQMDGLDDNNGILVVGSTNHLDELDPGIVARPSRFDRKYEFGLPGTGEGGRPAYVEYWRKKLESRPGIDFPKSLVFKIVDMTDGFSFAYIKEAFVSTLLIIAAKKGKGDESNSDGVFEKVIMQQLKNLRKQLGSE